MSLRHFVTDLVTTLRASFKTRSVPRVASFFKRVRAPAGKYLLQRFQKHKSKRLIKGKEAKLLAKLNTVSFLPSGHHAFKEMWGAIEKAKVRVWIEMYKLEPDAVGNRTIQLLTEAAHRGVNVVLIVDQIGSMWLRKKHYKTLEEAGAQVIVYKRGFDFANRIFCGTHRKVLIADDIVFTGSCNLTIDYGGIDTMWTRYCDNHFRLSGPVVGEFSELFVESLREMVPGEVDWDNFLHLHHLDSDLLSLPKDSRLPTCALVIRTNDPGLNRYQIQNSFIQLIDSAKRYIYITNPYFLPSSKLIEAFSRAAERGVEVKILTAGKSDVFFIQQASQWVSYLLAKKNVSIFEMQELELHAKTAIIDGSVVCFGSFNFDPVSFHHNKEIVVYCLDNQPLAQELSLEFDRQLSMSSVFDPLSFSKSFPPLLAFRRFLYRLARFIIG
eukprot:TRINITY_DN14245_c0_g1_i1.p1 TRINITY_DN14245_c0_g1~~TRINITY_DN14245_c0_g1_i1.p1  ORF type:complete len:469 (+),score=174.63 TRINITY_DN14245_c0_g1_i1:88-1407(+)